jgi:hypothetical protein
MRTLLSLLVLVALATVGTAHARPHRGPTVADNTGAKRDRIKQRIRVMRAAVLTEQLDLDEATAGKLFPVLNKWDDALARLHAERGAARTKLDAARRGGKPAEISTAIDELVANQRARWTAEEQRFAELRAVLSPEQAARLLDLLPEVDRKILRGLREVRGGRARRGPDDTDLQNPFDTRR